MVWGIFTAIDKVSSYWPAESTQVGLIGQPINNYVYKTISVIIISFENPTTNKDTPYK